MGTQDNNTAWAKVLVNIEEFKNNIRALEIEIVTLDENSTEYTKANEDLIVLRDELKYAIKEETELRRPVGEEFRRHNNSTLAPQPTYGPSLFCLNHA